MSPIKILSLHWGFSIGGIAQYTLLIDNIVDDEKIEIKNICILSSGRHVDEPTLLKLQDKEVIQRRKIYDFSWIARLRQSIYSYQPDFILTHGFNGHFVAMIIAQGIPKICSYHGEYHATTPVRNIIGIAYNKFTEFYIGKIAISAVCVARYCKEHLKQRGVAETKLRVIHNGIPDLSEVAAGNSLSLRSEWGVTDDEILLGVVSRLDPVKGLSYLITAFVELAKKNDHLKLVIIGTGTLEDSLKKQVRREEIAEQVIFTGFRSDIVACLQAIDIFILPSLAEYHSIGLLEAMRAEKTIIATNVGGNTESVRDGQEGLIIQPAHVDDIIDAVEKLLQSKTLRDSLAKSARKRFEESFTVEKTVEATAQWFSDCYESYYQGSRQEVTR